MKEDFLHYVWKFQKLAGVRFYTANNEELYIKKQGIHNFDSGPDFFNAQIELDNQLWAGNIEIHINSSDWYAHGHEQDSAYDNVILHVVWNHDVEVFTKSGSPIPTLIIQNYIPKYLISRYQKLFEKGKKWINCENDLASVDQFTIENWLERIYFERLEKKEKVLLGELEASKNHWEALLFGILCKNFGLKVNGDSFFSIARSLDFSVVKKSSRDRQTLEALLLGQAGLLSGDKDDWYFKTLKKNYLYSRKKYNLDTSPVIPPKFFRLRPPNFPTIRLAQLAMLYYERENLFSRVIETKTLSGFYDLFNVCASDYWSTHYNFGITSLERKKRITKSFMDLLIINTVLPVKFCYFRQLGNDPSEEIIEIASRIGAEKNSVIKKFNSIKPIAVNACQSQALLELKKEYCDKNRCLSCAIGNKIIGFKPEESAEGIGSSSN